MSNSSCGPTTWLTEDDVAFYVSEFSRTGFRGGLNWYRNITALPTILGPFAGALINQPALYLAGECDLIAEQTPGRPALSCPYRYRGCAR